MDNYEIRPGRALKVNISVANVKLFIGSIPKTKTKDEIMSEFSSVTGEVMFSFSNPLSCACGLDGSLVWFVPYLSY